MSDKRTPYKMLQLDIPRYEKIEEIAKALRMAAGGERRPTWGDVMKKITDDLNIAETIENLKAQNWWTNGPK